MSEIQYPVKVALSPDVPEEEADADTMQVILDATGRALEIEEIAEALNKTAYVNCEPPTEAEIAAYRDLFRAELDKRMDTKHPSASPSTESHAVALRAFCEKRRKCESSGAPK